MWLVAKYLSEWVCDKTHRGGFFQLNMDGGFYCASKSINQLTAHFLLYKTTWAETIFFIRPKNPFPVRNIERKL